MFTETLKETIFSRTNNNDYNFPARNAAPSNIKVLLAKNQSLLMIFKASFHTKAHPLVVLFVYISSSNSYNNMLMHDILNKDNPASWYSSDHKWKTINPCSIV